MDSRFHQTALPFSLISGNGFGISRTAAHIGAFLPIRTFGQAKVECAVNLATGNLIVQEPVLSFPDIGCPINFSYVYNSLSDTGWRFSYGREIKKSPDGSITLIEADAHEIQYQYDANSKSYLPIEFLGTKPIITENDNGFIYYDPLSRVTETFDNNGLLQLQTNKSGNQTQFEYVANQLTAVIAPSGSRYEVKR
ncbi:MAG: RHS repeat protein, partial [Gammaproteobacteria bacterium]|nr:RHS repeat protein [Gammaproteobacteria bacterium]